MKTKEQIRTELEPLSTRELQSQLRLQDRNGWLTLEDEEQEDREILIDALTAIYHENQ